ncbi:autotransporter assembly complex family protein [Paeniroseomonas aquatica]|uniref:Autotransporter assembly complex family protein n=1 Tax=Paeniroseomonas aquatica TaxID=373043 RepID=A0ABT7ZZ72_9PROT|nr:autotransporter assembly complex family protein [Paeniroseomonas aquatica]MDN3562780.1 autotransporter assembly complex family protein [Paeniroseomonas aquatica]
MQRFLRSLPSLFLLAGLAQARAQAPEPAPMPPADATLPYAVEVVPSGDSRLDAALSAVSQLVSLREQAPTSVGGVLGRAEGDRERLQQALRSEGYWAGVARITIDGTPLGDPELLARLEAAPRGTPVPVRITVEPGQAYRVSSIAVRGTEPAEQPVVDAAVATPFGIAPGDVARAEPVLAAERILLDRLLAAGHPLAVQAGRDTTVDHGARTMEIAWRLAPGPAATFAPPVVEGAVGVDPDFLRRQAGRIAGEPYSPATLEKARREMMALGPFGSVRARAAERLDAEGRLPTTFTVSERARHAVGVTAAYETNYGPTVKVYWEHRNLFGGAERLRIEGEVARIGTGGALDQMTYRTGATYRSPGVFGRDLTLVASIGALRERLEAYDRDAATASLFLERRLTEQWTVRAGPTAEFGSIGPPGGTLTPYQIVGVLFGGRYDGTDSLLDPSKGWRAEGTVTPSYSLRDNAPFVPLRLVASTYWDVLGDRRSILAVRGGLGSLLGAGRADVPRHLRYYAGGGGSVRGFDYQSIGPRDERNRPNGGASLVEGSLEWRQRVYGDFGAVAFVDAGAVSNSSLPDTSNLRVGAGLGVRYYTAIGPVRADVALPVVRQPGSSGYGLYVGIGQAF